MAEGPAGGTSYVVDASLLIELVVLRAGWRDLATTLQQASMHAPAHVDVEVMSALARLGRGGSLTREQAGQALARFADAPITRHPLPDLVPGAWMRADQLRITDALYVELAATLGTRVLTTDARLARASELAELLE